MKPFEDLTWRGQARRLRELARTALRQYELDVADVRLLGLHTNALFRVRSTGGQSYVLRVCRPGWRTATDLQSEAMWLQALQRDTDIGAPLPQRTRSGDFLPTTSVEGVPEPRRCMLMSWIPGRQLGQALTRQNLYKMGVLFARLHEHAAQFSPPPGFTSRQMNKICAREEEDVLLSDTCRGAFTDKSHSTFKQTRARVDRAFHDLYANPAGRRVIHNDLWHGNIKVWHGRLRPLDFEDTIWGYPVQDLAMALQDLMTDAEPGAYEPLAAALREGYESRTAWPETWAGQIDCFRAGRLLWVANYVARYERQHLREHVDRLTARFDRLLSTGVLSSV